MRTVYAMKEDQMKDWKQICKAFCDKKGLKLLFVNETSFGAEESNGNFVHMYIDELVGALNV